MFASQYLRGKIEMLETSARPRGHPIASRLDRLVALAIFSQGATKHQAFLHLHLRIVKPFVGR